MMLMLVIAAKAFGITCPSFICNSSNKIALNNQQCIFANSSAYYLQTCKNKLIPFCDPVFANSTCVVQPPSNLTGTAWPGEYCEKDSNCKYGMCYKSRCNAQGYGQPCSLDDQCNPGFYCSQILSTCQFQILPLASGCMKDADCQNTAGCNFGKCVFYYSLNSGENVETCSNYQNMLCQNLTCGAVNGGNYVCGSGVTSSSNVCTDSSNCGSSVDATLGYSINSTCQCSYEANARGFCTRLPGDSDFLNYISSMNTWVNSSYIRQCNTKRRFADNCIQMSGKFDKVIYYKLNVQLYPKIFNNSGCTKNIYNTQYWKLYSKFGGSKVSYE